MSFKREKQKRSWTNGYSTVAVAAFVSALLLLPGCSYPHKRFYIEIAQCESENIVLRLETRPRETFSIRFLHSYDKAPFEEHYLVLRDGRILLTHMTFKSCLNGQGFSMGVYRSRPDGSAELHDINQKLDQVIFRLGSPDLANHTLMINGLGFRLLDYADPGDLLCIRINNDDSS